MVWKLVTEHKDLYESKETVVSRAMSNSTIEVLTEGLYGKQVQVLDVWRNVQLGFEILVAGLPIPIIWAGSAKLLCFLTYVDGILFADAILMITEIIFELSCYMEWCVTAFWRTAELIYFYGWNLADGSVCTVASRICGLINNIFVGNPLPFSPGESRATAAIVFSLICNEFCMHRALQLSYLVFTFDFIFPKLLKRYSICPQWAGVVEYAHRILCVS